MKRQFFTVFLSLLLSGCGGDGSGTSLTGESSSKKPQSCDITNGSGHKVWDKTAKKYSTTCTVGTCNAGFDNDEDSTQCQTTVANYYSPANDKTRTACPTTPHSSATTTTGLSSTEGCYNCNGGYLKNTGENTCDVPSKGKYVDGSESEQSCDNVNSTPTGGFENFLNNTGAVATATDCNFSCNDGYVKSVSTYSCTKALTCTLATGHGTGQKPWNSQTSTYEACEVVDCDAGYDNTQVPITQCQTTAARFYSPDDNKNRIACPTPSRSSPTNRAGSSSPHNCWICNVGFLKNTGGAGSCDIPRPGIYVNASGAEQSCSAVRIALGFKNFKANNGAVFSATGCNFSCKTGYVKNRSSYTCSIPEARKYADATGAEQDCDSIGGVSVGSQFIKGTNPVSSPTTCPFTCLPGYVKDSGNRECNYPTKGQYVTSQGTQVSCRDLTSIIGLDSWKLGPADDADACPFTCQSAYDALGRTCVVKGTRPQTLALGEDTSYILLSSGEVQKWGESELGTKVDLGTGNNGNANLAQAIVSGDQHRCVLLKNGNLDHGPMKCWGANSAGQLGVGDTISKESPTDVDLGNDISSNPYTAKAVAPGVEHTCAILNDDTVKCWGLNESGQIGGGDPNPAVDKTGTVININTISGTVGDPLPGQTSSQIAAGAYNTCAIKSNGSVKCWGDNLHNKIGGGTPDLGIGKTATHIVAGKHHYCVILNDGFVKCWGSNPTLIGREGQPYLENKKAIQLAASLGNTCALLGDKTVKCWGLNRHGELGGGNPSYDQNAPVTGMLTQPGPYISRGTQGDPLDARKAAYIATANYHTCAILEADRSVKCWGRNHSEQLVGAVQMKLGSNGTGNSEGETQALTANSTPSNTALEADTGGVLCKVTLSGGSPSLSSPWIVMGTQLTYNNSNNTSISDAIDNLIGEINGDFLWAAGASITFSRAGNDKIKATVDMPIFAGMTLNIHHDNNAGDCSAPVTTSLVLGGSSDATSGKGSWIIPKNFTGSGDNVITLDNVNINLGNSQLNKEAIADKVVTAVNDSGWTGTQYQFLPYTATKIAGTDDNSDDCPDSDFCVELTRIVKGQLGNYAIPFPDSDYLPFADIYCDPGYVKNKQNNPWVCDTPLKGKYVDYTGAVQSCKDVGGDSLGIKRFEDNTGGVDSNTGCNFSCNLGFVKNTLDFTCTIPPTGKYADNGVETDCDDIVGGVAKASLFIQSGIAVSAPDACPFKCLPGHVKDSSNRTCNYPQPGRYLDNGGNEVLCTDISSIPNFKAWEPGPAIDANSCPFSCHVGYKANRNISSCEKMLKPVALALGITETFVLLENHEVRQLNHGKALPVDLGTTNGNKNLGQAIEAGQNHRCVILKNGNLNHGPLMCWGGNTKEELGVGDKLNRAAPTNVTVLRTATAKAVSAGVDQTCAILSDDTVQCWGDNAYSEIGGGSRNRQQITSGSKGDPLPGNTAIGLSTGWDFSCAILTGGVVRCWGYNASNEAGGGTPSLGAGRTATHITSGYNYSCALLDNGNVTCWGHYSMPTPNFNGKTASYIDMGSRGTHICVILNDNTVKSVKCFGSNHDGETGGGIPSVSHIIMGTVGDPLSGETVNPKGIGVGDDHTCAILTSDNSVQCWGRNHKGQAHDGIKQFFYDEEDQAGESGIRMQLGSDGTGQSTGESVALTTGSTPSATVLETDAGGRFCKLTLSGGIPNKTWNVEEFTTLRQPHYNLSGNTSISNAIDNLVAVQQNFMLAGANIILSKTGTNNDKIKATVDMPIFAGMTLNILHDDNAGDCSTPARTPILLGGVNNSVKAQGIWIITDGFTGSGDSVINLDGVEINLGTSALTNEQIADKVVTAVNNPGWTGRQYQLLHYTVTKVDGSSNNTDDCPNSSFCVDFNRIFGSDLGNSPIPFKDSSYEK